MGDVTYEEARELARLRRQARRQGYALRKSRKDGSLLIVDPRTNTVVAGGHGYAGCEYGLFIEDVEAWLGGV
jgi:hypothetical protein